MVKRTGVGEEFEEVGSFRQTSFGGVVKTKDGVLGGLAVGGDFGGVERSLVGFLIADWSWSVGRVGRC